MNPKVDNYLITGCMRCPLGDTPQCKVNDWQKELKALRMILLGCGLTEELKWGVPAYTYQKKNIILLSAFKESCVISFLNGVLLQDDQGILEKAGEHTQAGRIIRFSDEKKIASLEPTLRAYIFEAIEVEKAGMKIKLKTIAEHTMPEELQKKLDELPAFKTAFNALTPGRQRGYLLYFSQPKQSKTREWRIEKCMKDILLGKGIHDDYHARKK
jgi:uncharacterized protein YdeI (YjbR/CyaY-like superfamily)